MGPWGLLAQGIANTISAGVVYAAGSKLQQAQEKYANTMKSLAKEYSGTNANNQLTSAGQQQANISANREMEAAKQQAPSMGSTAMAQSNANADNITKAGSEGYTEGYTEGAKNKNTLMQGEYANKAAKAEANLEQANTNYQAAMNGASSLQNMGKSLNTISDERVKEYNNHSDLPKADSDDALRQIESISYQYKPETGLDQDEHVGVTAQSVEGTAFDDMVNELPNGMKALDKQKMLEAVMAGIASLRKELDELEK